MACHGLGWNRTGPGKESHWRRARGLQLAIAFGLGLAISVAAYLIFR